MSVTPPHPDDALGLAAAAEANARQQATQRAGPDGAPEAFAVHPLWAEFTDAQHERAFGAHLFETVHRREAPRNVLSALLAYAGLLAVDWLVVPADALPTAWTLRGAAIACFALLYGLCLSRWLRAIRPALPVVIAWVGSLHNLLVGQAIGGETGIVYRYFVVIFMSLPALIGRGTVREALACALGSFVLLQWTEASAAGSSVVWIFLSATCAIAGVYGVYGAWIYHVTAHREFWQGRVIAWQIEALADARARSDALLLNVLPAPIAARLKAGEGVIADSHADVTVLFADIVGFTSYAARVSPEALVNRLDAIFRRFDALAAAHGLEKIKTIGDAYMVAGGLPSAQPDHADRVAAFALDMVDAIAAVNAELGERFVVRVGVHSGPVVAGVIGERKFAYDLWGDAVNLASRMESRGKAGRIQLSAAAAEKLSDAFALEVRGAVEIKGIGAMETYWLVGRRAAPGAD